MDASYRKRRYLQVATEEHGSSHKHSLPTRRARAVSLMLMAIVLVGLLWLLQMSALLGPIGGFSLRFFEDPCAHMGHRDGAFIREETKDLCLPYDEMTVRIRDTVFAAVDLFERYNLTYFLESGTLLGAFREGGVIRRDGDADLGVDAATLRFLQQNPVVVPDGYHLTVWNSSLYPDSSRDDKLPARLIHKETALYADIFAFLDWKNETTGEDDVGPLPSICFSSCPTCTKTGGGARHFKVPRTWVYPLVDCIFEGRSLKCPRESAKYLRHMYGKYYMTPR